MKNTDKPAVRDLHKQAVSATTERARRGLERHEDRLIGYFAHGTEVDPLRMRPVLKEVVAGSEDELLFRYARLHWSIPVSPGYGRRLRAEVEAADHLASIGAMIADAPSGRVHGRRRAIVEYRMTRPDGRRLLQAIGVLGRVLLAAGATEVLTGIFGHDTARTVDDLDEALRGADHRYLHVGAFHPTGTARAGADSERSPVDSEGKLRGVEGMWVADASAIPSSPWVNPQVSIMALSLAVADRIVATA